MADYHMLNDGVFGVGGSDIMDDTANLVNAVSYSHSPSVNTAGQGMMSQNIPGTPGQNPNVMQMQGMVPMQQAQGGTQLSTGGMSSYHQGSMHGYTQNEVPQKLHQYSVYGSQLQTGNMGGQYMSGGPRLHHLNDPMSSIPDQQQSSPRTVVPNQVYQNRNIANNPYSQQMPHGNATPTQMTQGAAQYPGHYPSVPQHHAMQPQQQQHTVQQVNQSPDMWQNSMPHTQMNRPSLPASQNYPQHQMVPNQHGNSSLNHSPMMMQGQRPSTPNQTQYMSNQEYAAPQQSPMQRPPVYNMNSSSVNQNGSMVGQMSNAPQSGLSQNMGSIPQTEQTMTFPQGHYGASQTPGARPHYNANSAMGSTVGLSSQQHSMGQQMMNVRPSVHQMGYSNVPPRVNSGQQHANTVPPGSPARLQQYHPPYSPNQPYATQPSPRPTNPESGTPPHLQHYSGSQPHVQTQSPQMSPQYRSPFPSQVTRSPQHLTPTPPAEVSVPLPHTPERVLQSSTPQSQGSYHSPSTTHLASPGQGQSPGNSNAPSSLQHLEQMVLPRTNTGPSVTPVPSTVSASSTNTALNSSVGGNYYGHLSNSQQHQMHLNPVADARPQPQSPASFSQLAQTHSHHSYLNQTHAVPQQPSTSISNVPSSQPMQTNVPVSTLSNSALLSDESMPLESNQLPTLSFGSDNSSSMPSVMSSEPPSISINSSMNSSSIAPMSTSEPLNSSGVPTGTSDSMLQTPQQYNVHGNTSYQGNTSSIAFELQQLQQELQQLYNMHQGPENLEKMKAIQEKMRYLQAQQKAAATSNAAPMNSTTTPMSPHYQRPMVYNSGSANSYGHQPVVQQPQSVHYNPPNSQPPPAQDVIPPVQQSMSASTVIPPPESASPIAEQVPPTSEAVPPTRYPVSGPECMPPYHPPDQPDMMPPVNDPYEMTFNDDPPPKLKKRTPKEPKEPKPKKTPKSPKTPKEPKEPKPKKPRKGKNAPPLQPPVLEASQIGPDGIPLPVVPAMPVETMEGSIQPQVPGPDGEMVPAVPVPVPVLETPEKPKKAPRKRKAKEDDGTPKEPKPKKPRKKPEKKPKQLKEGEQPPTDASLNDGNNNSVTESADENAPPPLEPGAEIIALAEGTSVEGVSENQTKEKKSKSKSPKSKDGTPKEPKKSTPKKKLPKIALKFTSKKKKKKALQVSDNSDMERTPPPSPTDGDTSNKRRSARNTERKKYTDDIELHLSDDETIELDFGQNRQDGKLVQVVVDNHAEDYMLVEKILAIRTVKKQMDTEGSGAENNEADSVDVEEYFVKYKNLSYIHCEWKTLEELEKGDRRFIQKVKRFKQKKETFNFFDFLEEDPFNPDYVEVDRVLDVNEVKEPILDPSSSEDPEKPLSEQNPEESKEGDSNESEGLAKPEENIESTPTTATETSGDAEAPDTTVIKNESKSETETVDASEETMNVAKTEEPVASGGENVEVDVEVKNTDDESKTEEKAVINEEDDPKNYKIVRHYLVKWRALTYEESTWELEDDVDRDKIDQFLRFKEPPPKEKWKQKKRPRPSEWDQIPDSPVYKGGNTLREYQLEGVNWLTFCWYNSQNCILADEMGLGKTIQSITFLNEIHKYGIPGPFLVIAPLSTIGNWQREFETWTDLNAITYHGSSPSRNMILEYEMYWKNEKGERIQDVYRFEVMITTFEIILTDCMELKAIPWRCVIIDEAHRLKNRNCKLLEGLRMLNTEHRVLLTGTPLQNNVEELFSLLNFLEPTRFASTEAFLEEFGNLKTEGQVDKLKAILKPMMLRRLKEDVEKSLAPKEETVVEVELTNIQKKYYRAILERNFTFLTKGNCYSNMPNLMNTMMELRKCCIHPFLINGAEEQILHDYRVQHEETMDSHLNAMVQSSGKLVLMDKLLPRLRTDGHRVLVFSQMVRCLDILEDYLIQRRYPYERIDGRVRGNLRQAAIDRFCKPDSDRFVFLLCTRAGGLGINLTAADTVIIFDSDWNPQNDLQAQARCHRIGQSKAVKVYRLICRNTYEREMFDKASLKLGLDKAVLQSMSMKENVGMNQQMSKKEIEDLLRKGAYGALMEDDNAGDKFCEEDIDQILQRRTQVITLESGTKGSTFSKATFASASTRSDIEIDDPNFWEKWAKKANLDVDDLKNRNELIIEEPRRRTQTRRFGTDDLIDLSELESSDEDDDNISSRTRGSKKGSKKHKNGKGRDDDYMDDIPPGSWTRAECYKMEKGLLTFGWGRWDECMGLVQFRRRMSHKDCEDIARIVLLYCLLHYKGDEKIKSFIWDLIAPNDDGEERIHKNHSGLSAPVPRGRKGKKIKKETKSVDQIIEENEWTKEEMSSPDCLLNDEIYKRHLNRHSNKVLLRVRLLYYLKHEIIGDLHDQIFAGLNANDIPLFVPPCEGEPPTPWWDAELDKSLLLGIYKHGFERYNIMRQDPALCFLSKCGPPDGAALLAELQNSINNEDEEDPTASKDKDDDMETMSNNSQAEPSKSNIPNNYLGHPYEMGVIHFPSVTDVNTRVRRLVTAFQRNNKKLEIRNAQKAKKIERREKFEAAIREREMKKRELQQRKWSRREEADFYRTISSFGVEYNEEKKEYNWARFREQLAMNVEPISEERASRCLQRVELLNKIREEILCHSELDERLKLCQPSMDLPEWWVCGKHDKDLLIGAAKHGLSRMDYHLLHDPNLSFKDVLKNYPNAKNIQIGNLLSTPLGCPSPINIYQTDDMVLKDGIPKLKEELPILLDEMKKDEDLKKESSEVKSETEKDKSEVDDSVPPVLLPNSYHDKDTIDQKEKLTIKTEVKDMEVDDSKEQKVEEPATESANKEESAVEEPKVPENESEVPQEEKVADVDESEKMDIDTSVETSSMATEIKNDEEMKEDDETDIESDVRKDDEEQKGKTAEGQEKKDSAEPNAAIVEQEIEDKKYDYDTDTESKVEASQTNESSLPTQVKVENEERNVEAIDKVPNLKSEESYEDIKEKYGIHKMMHKDDILHSHVDDSQMKYLFQGCMSQNDDIMSQASYNYDPEMGEPTVAQLLAFSNGNAVRWPKDKVLQIRLEHIVHAVEKNEWPIIRHTFLPTFPNVPSSSTPIPHPPVIASPVSHRASPVPSVSSQGHSGEVTPQATPEHTPARDSIIPDISTPSPVEFSLLHKNPLQHSIPTPPLNESSKSRRRRRRRRFEIEAERAKLRQLLSHNMQQQQHHHQQQLQHVQQFLASSSLRNKMWDDHVDEKVQLPTVPSPAPSSTPVSASIPPPAHQNSSPRMSTTVGTLDLRVKQSITPPTPFTPLPAPQKQKTPPSDAPASTNASPSSPIDLSASSSGTGGTSQNTQPKTKTKEKRGARGGSRIDALALNLQARKQQQLMQEQHHPLADIGSMIDRTSDKRSDKDHSESDEPPPPPMPSRHHSHHHNERRSIEDEEARLRKKRLQYSEENVRKALNRGFDMNPSPAHSSFLNPSMTNSGGRLLGKGSGKGDEHGANNPMLDHSALMHHDFKKWIDEHPELIAANPNLVAAAAAAMAFSPVSSFPSHTELLELPEGRRRGRRPRLDPTKLDYDKITGEENVSVINRLTGKKGNLPNTMSKRIVTPSEKRGRRTAASLLASAHQNLVPPVTTMSFPSTTGLNPLNFANTGMLSGFPNMKFFMDPSKSSTTSSTTTSTSTSSANPPIFLPFGGLSGMGLTNPLFGFPGFNFPGLQGSSPLGTSNLPSSKDSDKGRSDKDSGSASSRKSSVPASSSATTGSMSSASSLPSSSLPFLYPPGLLYNPLGLGGFTLPPNLPASFGSFTQSGLVNGLGLSNPLFTTSSLNTSLSSSMTTATVTSPAAHSILSSAPLASKSPVHHSSNKSLASQSHFGDGQETDDESLKSLMGNHDDDDDDLDDGKLDIYDNPDRDDSDKEAFRDSAGRSPASSSAAAQANSKNTHSDSEGVFLAKTAENPSVESKSRGMHDDPTSDSTDTESKHS